MRPIFIILVAALSSAACSRSSASTPGPASPATPALTSAECSTLAGEPITAKLAGQLRSLAGSVAETCGAAQGDIWFDLEAGGDVLDASMPAATPDDRECLRLKVAAGLRAPSAHTPMRVRCLFTPDPA